MFFKYATQKVFFSDLSGLNQINQVTSFPLSFFIPKFYRLSLYSQSAFQFGLERYRNLERMQLMIFLDVPIGYEKKEQNLKLILTQQE